MDQNSRPYRLFKSIVDVKMPQHIKRWPSDLSPSEINRSIEKILRFSWELEQGNNCQITKLMPMQRLIKNDLDSKHFFSFLIDQTLNRLIAGDSLSMKEIIEVDQKIRLYARLAPLIRKYTRENDRTIKYERQLIETFEFLSALSPSRFKSISIHATKRRNLEDPDLVLLEETIRYSLNRWYNHGYWAFQLAKYYCCDYAGCRFIPTPASAPRVRDIADFFRSRHMPTLPGNP